MESEFERNRIYIKKRLPDRDLLEALAEESAELNQSALKLIRAKGYSKHVTPVSVEEARKNLIEEVADVMLVVDAMGIYLMYGYEIDEIIGEKTKRWVDRLEKEYGGDGLMERCNRVVGEITLLDCLKTCVNIYDNGKQEMEELIRRDPKDIQDFAISTIKDDIQSLKNVLKVLENERNTM